MNTLPDNASSSLDHATGRIPLVINRALGGLGYALTLYVPNALFGIAQLVDREGLAALAHPADLASAMLLDHLLPLIARYPVVGIPTLLALALVCTAAYRTFQLRQTQWQRQRRAAQAADVIDDVAPKLTTMIAQAMRMAMNGGDETTDEV